MMEENPERHYRRLSDASADSAYSDSSNRSIELPPAFTTTASSSPLRSSNRRDGPPDLLNEDIRLREREVFIRLYERNHRELQECIKSLRRLVNTFEEDFRRATKVTRGGGVVGIAGGVTMLAGLALAPFTMGASAVVAGTGTVVALGGGIGSGIINLMKMYQQKELRQNVKNRFEEFQHKIIHMTGNLDVICQCSNEILSVRNNPEHDISGFSKCVATARVAVRIIRIDDVGEVAAQMFKTVRLTGSFTGMFAAVGLVLDVLSVMEDNQALDDMDKLGKNGQISESEIKSAAGRYIVEMRKAIHGLQKIMDELEKTRGSIVNGTN